ncbi:MAG: sigma-70 family RNA polymerase sigma factor [Chloroflexota bacterium]|nr:sigma-70 family RNA polymerase sigma factor [Chloroflexota bacterium]
MSKDEARLIRRAKEGDPAAFAEIYDRHQPAIYRYIFYRVDNVATAEELASEVFVRLVDSIEDFTYHGRPLLAWLYTIAHNLVTDHYRSTGRATMVPLKGKLVSNISNPEDVAENAFVQRRLAAAIDQLTEGQRHVILLKFFEGLDNKTVARILDKSYGAVKSLQHRGLAALRRILESDEW